jgi:hypothetical protein
MAVHEAPAPADRVWALLGSFRDAGGLSKGFVARIECDSEDVGATRTFHLHPDFGGGTVVERHAARDEKGMYYAYELAETGPMPVTDYYGSCHVIPVGEWASRVIWTNRYRPMGGASEADLRAHSLGVFDLIERNMLRALQGATAE